MISLNELLTSLIRISDITFSYELVISIIRIIDITHSIISISHVGVNRKVSNFEDLVISLGYSIQELMISLISINRISDINNSLSDIINSNY